MRMLPLPFKNSINIISRNCVPTHQQKEIDEQTTTPLPLPTQTIQPSQTVKMRNHAHGLLQSSADIFGQKNSRSISSKT